MKFVPFAVVLVALGAGTFIEGKLSDRWGRAQSSRLDDFTQRLSLVPKEIGPWTGVDDAINEEEFIATYKFSLGVTAFPAFYAVQAVVLGLMFGSSVGWTYFGLSLLAVFLLTKSR